MTRAEILDAAKTCVCGWREQDYGSPEDNFARIAEMWRAYKGVPFSLVDVAVMMSLLKIARIATGTKTEDSFVDLAGYAACGGEIAAKEAQTSGPVYIKTFDLPENCAFCRHHRGAPAVCACASSSYYLNQTPDQCTCKRWEPKTPPEATP